MHFTLMCLADAFISSSYIPLKSNKNVMLANIIKVTAVKSCNSGGQCSQIVIKPSLEYSFTQKCMAMLKQNGS